MSDESSQERLRHSGLQPLVANDVDPDPQLTTRQVMIWNEERKLIAGTWDRLGTMCATVGAATPLALWLYGPLNESRFAWWVILPASSVWILATIACHFTAREALKGLRI